MPKNDATDEATSGATEAATATPRKGGRKKGKRKHNKTAYVREAIEVKGRDASNQDLLDYIKTRHRVSINPSHFSNIKSNVLKEKGSGSKRQAANGAPRKETARGGASTTKAPSLEDMRTVKDLIGRLGRKGLHEVIDLFQE